MTKKELIKKLLEAGKETTCDKICTMEDLQPELEESVQDQIINNTLNDMIQEATGIDIYELGVYGNYYIQADYWCPAIQYNVILDTGFEVGNTTDDLLENILFLVKKAETLNERLTTIKPEIGNGRE